MVDGDRPASEPSADDDAADDATQEADDDAAPAQAPEQDEGSRPPERRSRRRRRGRLLGAVALGVVVLLVAGFAAVQRWDLGDRWGWSRPDPTENPAAVPPPEGFDLPAPGPAAPVAAALPGVPVDGAAVRKAISGLLADRRLGRQVTVDVAGLDGRPVFRHGPPRTTPASTLKLLTCLAALQALGPEHRFGTESVLQGRTVTLVGGGDPLLEGSPADDESYPERADLATLARRTAAALTRQGVTRVRLRYDDSLFSGPPASPAWEPDYLPDDVVSPITALWVDEGRRTPGLAGRSSDPARDAAVRFGAELRRHGVAVVGEIGARRASRRATTLATVLGAPLVQVVEHVLEVSDNEGAEVLARQVALAEGRPPTFAGGADAVRAVVRRLGVPVSGATTYDGSGLSRHDRVPVRALLGALAVAADPGHPRLTGLVEGLPVAGFSGSLAYRFALGADPGLGYVRAKTGTLTGVHGLAGLAVGRDGSVMTFVAVADRVPPVDTLFARARLDRVAAALAGCSCADRG